MTNRVENNCHTANQGYQEDSRHQRTEPLYQRSAPWELWVLWARAAHTAVLSLPILHISLFFIVLFILFRRSCMRNAVPDTIEHLLLLPAIRPVKAAQIRYYLGICS